MTETDTYILFELAGFTYGIRSQQVQRVEMFEHVTPVPNTAPSVDGVIFSRGKVIPALNLRARFGLPRIAATPKTRVIILNVQQRVVSLIVDAAREFHKIPASVIRPIEETLHGVNGNYVEGVATVKDRMVLLLDVGAVLDPEEINLPEGSPSAPAV
ncbi:chemotaxis protein CheW [Oleiharenicola lentus]|uniref:chemotaxis protein CheW n=1 Tax=Oleiharenicola lentus TaxID=2508720 RepID=UPI003F67B459